MKEGISKTMPIIEFYKEREKKENDFYDNKKYLLLINEIINKNIDNDSYREPMQWTDEVDIMFSFLFKKAKEITEFEDTVYVKHKDIFIELFEIHGQGCYRRIETLDKKPDCYVEFRDIVKLQERGKKPYKSQVLEVVNKALDIMDLAIKDTNHNFLDIEDVKKYIKDNLG